MTVKDIAATIEAFAPPAYQESYDNCGIQVGNPADEVTGVLITLDVTEAIVDEAIERGCNMIVAHHPLIFSGLKKIMGRTYVERVVRMAIKNDITIYAAHTNLDNVHNGVNAKIAEKLGLINTRVLAPKGDLLSKLFTYVPLADADKVRDALFAAGAGQISNYSECSFNMRGTGTFRPGENTNPTIGQTSGPRENVEEVKIEVLVNRHEQGRILAALRASHPYEEVAYEFVPLSNLATNVGSGMVGELPQPMKPEEMLAHIKASMKAECIRHTAPGIKRIEKVALCGGSGSFLLRDAIAAGADIFITADYKYHQFFDAEGKIIIADIGHYESEQFTSEIFADILRKKYPNFAVLLSNLSTNPVKYFY
ncbi:MAG: Nif3-like dinuclear metal center hexameric protein [Taibaiella sp.]|nr:Nif3-like dinuclear metal center hexameric protein [Taibaiella sp.]